MLVKGYMEQNQAIKKILLEAENFQAHLKRVSKPGHQLHPLDIDLMLDKLRFLYEEVMRLQGFTADNGKEIAHMTPKTEAKEQPGAEPVEIVSARKEETAVELPKIAANVPESSVESNNIAPAEKPVSNHEINPEPTSPVVELKPEIIMQEPIAENPEPKPMHEPAKSPVKTTLDLFAQTGMESIASRFGADEDPSIAARMQKARINDLRTAIGINDKFLFINELFRGNMQQYNKALDELNDFKSLGGAQTYLMELKVEHQWDAESNAFNRLNYFVERRFGA